MKVRFYEPNDFERVYALAQQMHDESVFRIFPFREEKAHTIARMCCERDDFLMLVAEREAVIVGFFVGFRAEHFFSDSTYASDLALYVDPPFRGSSAAVRLMATFEGWARHHGCAELRIGAAAQINPAVADKLFKGLGFQPGGALYTKSISPLSGPH